MIFLEFIKKIILKILLFVNNDLKGRLFIYKIYLKNFD